MNRPVLFAAALAVCFATVWTSSALADRRVALVVGNSAYENAPALPNPTNDAEAIAAKLKEAGFDVVSAYKDLANLPFKRAIRQFEDAAADADIVVVFYAGHGIEVRGVNYMIPVDAKLASDRDAEDEAITLDRLLQSVEGARRLGLVILDACRDNPFVRTMKRSRTAMLRAITSGLGAVEPSTSNTLVAYAAKAGTGAEDGISDHSPFTTALMKHLFVKGLDIRLAFGRVRDEVLKTTRGRQEPFVYGSVGGESISVVPAPAQATAATVDPQGERADYQLVEKIGTKRAWEVFLTQHPKGFYSELARQQIDKLAALEPSKPPSAPAPSSEERRVWDKIKDSSNAAQLRDFIKRYPSSPLANTAQNRLQALEQEVKEREQKARLEREAKAAEAARRQAELEQKARAEREAKAAEAARQQAEREAKAAEAERQKAEREAAAKHAEEERTARLAAAARAKQEAAEREEKARAEREARAAEAARLRAERDAAMAEAARQKAERDATAKRAEEERIAKLAEAARAKQEEAARQQAEREAREAEAEKQRVEREAATKREEQERIAKPSKTTPNQEEACAHEQGLLEALTAAGSQGWAKEDLKRLQHNLTCERLRPRVTAALEAMEPNRKPSGGVTIEPSKPASNTPELVRSAQKELARIGCFTGGIDGILGINTTTAIKRYQAERGRAASDIEITERLVSELMDQSSRVCPLVCPTGKVAEGDQCIAARPSAPAARQKNADEDERALSRKKGRQESKSKAVARQKDIGEDRRSRARPQESRPQRAREETRPQPRVRQEAKTSAPRFSGGGGGGGHGPTIGVGF